MSNSASGTQISRYSGVIKQLSAAEQANVDERGIPKKLGRMQRDTATVEASFDEESGTVTMAVSSSTPVERWFGQEILSHEKGAIRTNRLKNGVALLFNHNYDAQVGRSQSFELGDPLHVTAGFGPSDFAQEKMRDVKAGILVDVSIGYIVHEWEITEDKNGVRTYLAVDWELLEVSLVTVPADPTVGVGRDAKDAAPLKIRSFRKLEDDDKDPDDDTDEDDEDSRGAGDDEEDEEDEEERSAASPSTRSNNSNPETPIMADVKDPAEQRKERTAALRSFRKMNPNQYSEDELHRDMDSEEAISVISERIATKVINDNSRHNVRTISEELFDGMSETERRSYSIRNVYARAVNQVRPGTFDDKGAEAGFEREVSDTLRKLADKRGITGMGAGIIVPSASDRSLFRARQDQQRAIAAGGNAGTYTNFTTVESDPIEMLRFKTAVLALGARMMTGLHGALSMPGQTGAASSNWLAEASSVTSSDPTLGAFTMTPKRLSIANSYYRDFLAQSALAVESFLAADRQQVLARSLDSAGIAGSGVSPVPTGLLNKSGLAAVLAGTVRASSGVVTAGLGGVPMTYVDWNNLEAAISTANGDIGTMGILLTPKLRAAGRSTPKIPGTASEFIFPDSKVGANGIQEGPLGYNAIATANPVLTGFTANSVNNLHAAIMGVWDQMLIGDWGLSEVIADPYTGAANALFKITEHAFYDIAFRHIECFAACTSALPS